MIKALFLTMVSSILFLTGCWSRVEINERSFVSSILVDKGKNGKIDVTLTFPLPNRLATGQSGGSLSLGKPYASLTYSGTNISQAFHKMQVDLPRKISFGQAKLVIIGQEMAKEGIKKILEFIIREPGLNINLPMYIAPGKAKEIIHMAPTFEKSQSRILLGFSKNEIALLTTPKDFFETVNGDMAVSILKVGKRKMVSENGKKVVWVGTDGVALFKNYKMVDKLTSYEGRGALWLRNTIKQALVTIQSPTDHKEINLTVLQAKAKIHPSKNEPYAFDVHFNVEDDLAESDSTIDLSKEANIKKLELLAEKDIRKRIEAAFTTSKKTGADAFQFGEYLSWYKPKIWKKAQRNWTSIYQDKVKLNITVDLKIKRRGTENNPFWTKELSS
ncbi:Ger(x)C family spore germination protein [Neobacillus drentensis]|uniref:Ger(x)C family spore germination protein n=1 Tax=Neobacillus drentensis TaxID=220684 RepID=UPI001F41957C|nr:Ger(x)C family spore germination protein [Neobacillus drentensis]ULT57278.1 Ger(x)C family spore germination protein [Neobacillus drentensis]